MNFGQVIFNIPFNNRCIIRYLEKLENKLLKANIAELYNNNTIIHFKKLNISTEFSTHFYFIFKLPKNKFMICIESLINDSGHKNTQSLDTIII